MRVNENEKKYYGFEVKYNSKLSSSFVDSLCSSSRVCSFPPLTPWPMLDNFLLIYSLSLDVPTKRHIVELSGHVVDIFCSSPLPLLVLVLLRSHHRIPIKIQHFLSLCRCVELLIHIFCGSSFAASFRSSKMSNVGARS